MPEQLTSPTLDALQKSPQVAPSGAEPPIPPAQSVATGTPDEEPEKAMTAEEAFLSTLEWLKPDHEPIEIPFPNGAVWKFAPITNKKQRATLRAQAASFADELPRAGSKMEEVHPFKGFIPEDKADAVLAYELHRRCLFPGLTHLQALQFVATPTGAEWVAGILDLCDKDIGFAFRMQSASEAKKASKGTGSSESES